MYAGHKAGEAWRRQRTGKEARPGWPGQGWGRVGKGEDQGRSDSATGHGKHMNFIPIKQKTRQGYRQRNGIIQFMYLRHHSSHGGAELRWIRHEEQRGHSGGCSMSEGRRDCRLDRGKQAGEMETVRYFQILLNVAPPNSLRRKINPQEESIKEFQRY